MKKFISFAVIIIIFIAVGVYIWQRDKKDPRTQDEATKQAQEYKPEGTCTQALVSAVHKATGAKYTFNSGCLAPGWEPER
ncbi:hypothetical protein HY003_02645 [Candidatus Saccharibacteria bacterium]|nr:hypothetical protein [Candidatus Saccharibacteria bacterium]MBI3338176.1 hypothetical protein [Candidatus Saccharibacteria bacterium]